MGENIQSTPVLMLSGKIAQCQDFPPCESMYVKYQIVMGEAWKVLSGKTQGESFEAKCFPSLPATPIEQPFNLQLQSKQLRGWPKFIIEVWQVDQHHRHNIAGYTQTNVPFQPGVHHVLSQCWRPRLSFMQRISGRYPELQYRDVIVEGGSRNGFQTESTGTVCLELNVVAKDFQFHGVNLG